jgi:hypothetical protein
MAGAEYHIGYRLAARPGRAGTLPHHAADGIPGRREYSVDCVGDQGRLVTAVVRRKLPQAGGGQLIDMRADILEATASCAARTA